MTAHRAQNCIEGSWIGRVHLLALDEPSPIRTWCVIYTHHVSKRLQVLLDADEWAQLQEIARRHRTTVSEWVRRTLREAREREPGGDLETKLRAVRAAARHEFPTADIEEMLEEIERGRTR